MVGLCLWGILLPGLAAAARDGALADLSLEELMDLEVTLAARRPQTVAHTAAAVSVVTGEELRRSGVRSLPDALRLVPGLQVGQIDANKWVVTSRGFAGLFSNKLLVLIDGRSVYSPLFGGVFWESQHVLPEDVERIEVLRGPGGTLWGANAVNGIINIVTMPAEARRGPEVMAGGGGERRFIAARNTSAVGPGFVRVSVESFARERSRSVEARAVRDDWHLSRASARADLPLAADQSLLLLASVQSGQVGQSLRYTTSVPPPEADTVYADTDVISADLQARWRRQLAGDGEIELQAWYDVFFRHEPVLEGTIQNLDLDARLRQRHGRHHLGAGVGYRLTADDFHNSFTMALSPARRTQHLVSGFVHDEITLRPERLSLSLGSKFEHNGFSGFEWQPDARLRWTPHPGRTLWAAVSRAVRTPTRGEHDFRAVLGGLPPDSLFAGAPPALIRLYGDENTGSERLVAVDIGGRAVLGQGWTVDLAAFRNAYDNLYTQEVGFPVPEAAPAPLHLVIPVRAGNRATATTRGLEAALEWEVRSWWQLRAIYAWLDLDVDLDPGSRDSSTYLHPGESPRHHVGLRSMVDLGSWSLYGAARWVAPIDNPGIDAYATADLRAGRALGDNWEVSLTGRNLLQAQHREAVSNIVGAVHTAVQREMWLTVGWRR